MNTQSDQDEFTPSRALCEALLRAQGQKTTGKAIPGGWEKLAAEISLRAVSCLADVSYQEQARADRVIDEPHSLARFDDDKCVHVDPRLRLQLSSDLGLSSTSPLVFRVLEEIFEATKSQPILGDYGVIEVSGSDLVVRVSPKSKPQPFFR